MQLQGGQAFEGVFEAEIVGVVGAVRPGGFDSGLHGRPPKLTVFPTEIPSDYAPSIESDGVSDTAEDPPGRKRAATRRCGGASPPGGQFVDSARSRRER